MKARVSEAQDRTGCREVAGFLLQVEVSEIVVHEAGTRVIGR